jgi:hypothetical protein
MVLTNEQRLTGNAANHSRRSRTAAEQQSVDRPRLVTAQVGQGLRQGEDHVVVLHAASRGRAKHSRRAPTTRLRVDTPGSPRAANLAVALVPAACPPPPRALAVGLASWTQPHLLQQFADRQAHRHLAVELAVALAWRCCGAGHHRGRKLADGASDTLTARRWPASEAASDPRRREASAG